MPKTASQWPKHLMLVGARGFVPKCSSRASTFEDSGGACKRPQSETLFLNLSGLYGRRFSILFSPFGKISNTAELQQLMLCFSDACEYGATPVCGFNDTVCLPLHPQPSRTRPLPRDPWARPRRSTRTVCKYIIVHYIIVYSNIFLFIIIFGILSYIIAYILVYYSILWYIVLSSSPFDHNQASDDSRGDTAGECEDVLEGKAAQLRPILTLQGLGILGSLKHFWVSSLLLHRGV